MCARLIAGVLGPAIRRLRRFVAFYNRSPEFGVLPLRLLLLACPGLEQRRSAGVEILHAMREIIRSGYPAIRSAGLRILLGEVTAGQGA